MSQNANSLGKENEGKGILLTKIQLQTTRIEISKKADKLYDAILGFEYTESFRKTAWTRFAVDIAQQEDFIPC